MKVSISWLRELVDLNVSVEELVKLLNLKTIQTKVEGDDFIELDMKGYNRSDLLSLRGVAHEIAAITDSKVKFTEYTEKEEDMLQEVNLSKLDIEIQTKDLAPVYCLAKIEGLEVAASDPSWVKKLTGSGQRTVNNVADITNLVMLEYGQPMHAFDSKQVADQKIVVRTAKDGEELMTLDWKLRKLTSRDLLITDKEKILGLAGIMGGKESEISNTTSTILLEAAIFDPITIRKTVTRLGLQSEASKRFQHGLTKKRLLQAFSAAIKMYQELGGKLTGIVVLDHLTTVYPKITLNHEKVKQLIGLDMTAEEIEKYLYQLDFKIDKNIEGWEVTPPYFRLDIQIEEDVIEEIARMHGYDRIPAKPLEGNFPKPIDQSLYSNIYDLQTMLADSGFNEVQTYSFCTKQILENTHKNRERLIKIENPMSSETEYLRDEVWPNLLEVVAKNLKQGLEQVAVFEVGKVYLNYDQTTPVEKYKLSIAISDNSDNPSSQLTKSIANVLTKLDLKIEVQTSDQKEIFHPTRQGVIIDRSGIVKGVLAEVHPRVSQKLGINKRVGVAEIEIEFKS